MIYRMSERVLAFVLLTAVVSAGLFGLVALIGFERTVIVALAGIGVLAVDAGR